MKKFSMFFGIFFAILLIFGNAVVKTQGYQVGDTAVDFSLKNIDGKTVSLQNFPQAKGYIVVFTCNHCPYAIANEDRINALNKKYAGKGFPVVAINPNDASASPEDSFENMQKRAKEKGFSFPYLLDETQQIAKTYGATKTPHVYLLDKNRVVKYIGAIDDSPKDAKKTKQTFLANAVEALLAGKSIENSTTTAIGCGIKWKK